MTSNKEVPLNEYIVLQRGFDLPKDDRKVGCVPVVASTGVAGYHSEAKASAPGVVIGRSGSIGGGQYITEDYWPLNTTLWIKDFKGHCPRYVYYLLRNIDFKKFNVGSGVPTLNRNHLSTVLVPEIGLEREKQIANILGCLDDKIELNRQTNQTLEHIAQALFKCWFVDFEPTRAKIIAKEKGENSAVQELAAQAIICGAMTLEQLEAITQNLETTLQQAINEKLNQANQTPINTEQLKTTAALFPNELVDSELGEIPEGWEVQTIDNVTSNIIDHRGKTPKKLGGDWVDKGYPAISAKNVKGGRLVRHETIRFLSDELYSKWMKVEIEKGDILLTSEAPMGEMYFITDEIKYCLSQRLYGLRADNKNVTPAFLYLWLQTSIAQADLEGRATGTTVVGIRQVELKKVNVLIPSFEIVKIIESIVFSLYEKINANDSESKELSDLRDTLLPKLLSGDLLI